jgi:signal transduction histidine kinase
VKRPGTRLSPPPEQRLITRTWRAIAVQTALVFAVAIIALDGLAIGLVLYTSHTDAERRVSQAAGDPDAITVPPAGVWVYQQHRGALRTSPGAPPAPVDPAALTAVAAGRPAGTHQVRRNGREYLVRTDRRGPDTVQVALDLSSQEYEQHRLYLALAAAGAVGLGLAALVGTIIARRAITPLGQAMARQQRFVADASHELRTPLTQLHTRAQLLDRELSGGADPLRLATDAAALVRGTRQMSELVEELLLAAQLRTEPAHFGPVDLAAVAAEVCEAERTRAAERHVSIELIIHPGSHVVRGISPAVGRVLTSLVDNALAHTSARIQVEVGTDHRDATVSCTVRDDGIGFDPAEADRLFERFARGNHGHARRFGIGLALVKEAVQAHGGGVTATGQPGGGAAFTVTLPAWAARSTAPDPAR